LEQCCRRLVEAAKDAGGPDNVTVVLLRKAA
jgi:serine/threonine protein phosphatase PrpC